MKSPLSMPALPGHITSMLAELQAKGEDMTTYGALADAYSELGDDYHPHYRRLGALMALIKRQWDIGQEKKEAGFDEGKISYQLPVKTKKGAPPCELYLRNENDRGVLNLEKGTGRLEVTARGWFFGDHAATLLAHYPVQELALTVEQTNTTQHASGHIPWSFNPPPRYPASARPDTQPVQPYLGNDFTTAIEVNFEAGEREHNLECFRRLFPTVRGKTNASGREWPQLTRLCLSNNIQTPDSALWNYIFEHLRVCGALPKLNELQLNECDISSIGAERIASLRGLRSLHLNLCSLGMDAAQTVRRLLSGPSKLESLDLTYASEEGVHPYTGATATVAAEPGAACLKQLEIQGDDDPNALQAFAQSRHLRRLENATLWLDGGNMAEGINALTRHGRNFPHLRRLEIWDEMKFTTEQAREWAERLLQALPALTSVKLIDNTGEEYSHEAEKKTGLAGKVIKSTATPQR